jgi:hypothetical protein
MIFLTKTKAGSNTKHRRISLDFYVVTTGSPMAQEAQLIVSPAKSRDPATL